MRHEPYEELKTPRVAKHFPSLTEDDNISTNIYMFVEDVQLAIMPIGGESRLSPNFTVEIQANPDHKTLAVTLLGSLNRDEYAMHSLEKLLSTSVEEIARELSWNGCSVYEIVRDEDNDGGYLLHYFTPRRLLRVFGRYIQIVPKADRSLWKKAYFIIPKTDVWEIAMPKELGGCRGFRAMIKNLSRFQHLTPSFLINNLSRQEWPAHYDSQRYVRETEFFEAKITTQWGWDRRDRSLRNWTEFYFSYRNLQFKWAQAVVREHIVNELNRLFQRLHIEAKIIMKGLPTASEILEIRQHMCEGDISFMEAYDACSV